MIKKDDKIKVLRYCGKFVQRKNRKDPTLVNEKYTRIVKLTKAIGTLMTQFIKEDKSARLTIDQKEALDRDMYRLVRKYSKEKK